MGVHWIEKYLINSRAFSLTLTKNVLLRSRGGILGALHLFTTRLIIFQYDFWCVLGFANSLPNLFK